MTIKYNPLKYSGIRIWWQRPVIGYEILYSNLTHQSPFVYRFHHQKFLKYLWLQQLFYMEKTAYKL